VHTVKVLGAGFAVLALCLLLGRWLGGSTPAAGLALGAKIFLPLWLIGAGVNLWVGVAKAGYSVSEEAPVFAIVFAVPAAAAVLAWWLASRG
jgi:hypothetical protein